VHVKTDLRSKAASCSADRLREVRELNPERAVGHTGRTSDEQAMQIANATAKIPENAIHRRQHG
jgi:hypothetical protein